MTVVKARYEQVEIVKSVRVGESINSPEQHKGFDFTLVLEFEDEAALQKYLEHPETKAKKAELLDPYAEETIIVDFKY
ncbi:hypothetical protein HWV62_34653 [Athelia sp. TMB]|nr:hypothetical protein HWV62_34653 [Athelia sp. TMB]